MKNKIIILFLCVWTVFSSAYAVPKNDKKKKEEKVEKKDTTDTKKTPYRKLLEGKAVKTVKGLITLHKIDGKVYFELPKTLLGRKMLLGSTVEAISNSGYGLAGQTPHDPLCICFVQSPDSSILIRDATQSSISGEKNIQQAIDKNNTGAIMASFKVKAISPDSSAVVFEATNFFVNGNKKLDPFSPVGGLYSRKSTYNSTTSQLCDIMAYEDNVSITSYLSYKVTSGFFGMVYEKDKPATALMKRSLMLLPEKQMRPRINDPRIGIFYTRHLKYSGEKDGVKPVYYANRWKLAPKDTLAFKKGELTEPIKPIVFYMDTEFPPKWKNYVKEGAKRWNKAFEAIGFKNAIVIKPYPLNDPEFDPNNMKYNCIKYAPTETQNSMGPSWTDPRTGEILNASVYLYHGVIDLISDWLFFQTAVADKRVRTKNIPDEIIGEAISYITAHEVGHCLGLMHNMAASFAFPVDSLRSPSFTQKYGTTASIMDYARFNFIAQEGDLERGVKLTPPDLGVYDRYVIKWLYTPIFEAKTPEEEVSVLDKWISERIQDPMYRYGKQQIYSSYDPSSQTEDLGNDQVKATRYAFNNLKYILANMNDWLKAEDKDMSFRKKMAFSVINIQFYWYFKHVLANVGGIYLYEKYEKDPGPAYQAVPKDVQRESILFLLDALEHLSWMNEAEVCRNIDAIHGDPSCYLRTVLFPYVMRWVANIGLSEEKAVENPYSREECINDVFDYVWGSTIAGGTPTPEKLSMQKLLVKLLINGAGVKRLPGAKAKGITSLSKEQQAFVHLEMLQQKEQNRFEGGRWNPANEECGIFASGDVNGFGFQRRVSFLSSDISHIYYGWLLKNKDILKKIIARQKGDVKLEYQYLLRQINNALKVE